MLIKIFNKKITLDCFTVCPKIYDSFKLKKEGFPKWAKEETIKNTNFNSIYKNNITVPLWTDLTIEVDTYGNVNYELSDNNLFKLNNYPPNEYDKLMFSNVILLKLNSPWFLKEKKGINFAYNGLLWNHIKLVDKFWFLNKILSFKNIIPLDIDFLISIKPGYQGIEAGTDVMQLIPITDKEINIQHHLIDQKEMLTLNSYENNR
jgi:hypothetical protein